MTWRAGQKDSGWMRLALSPGAPAIASTAYGTGVTNTAAIAVPEGSSKLAVFLNITAKAGTGPILDVDVEWSPDGGTTWFNAETQDEFAQLSDPAVPLRIAKQFSVLAPHYRLEIEVGGTTPSFTLAVDHAGVYA